MYIRSGISYMWNISSIIVLPHLVPGSLTLTLPYFQLTLCTLYLVDFTGDYRWNISSVAVLPHLGPAALPPPSQFLAYLVYIRSSRFYIWNISSVEVLPSCFTPTLSLLAYLVYIWSSRSNMWNISSIVVLSHPPWFLAALPTPSPTFNLPCVH